MIECIFTLDYEIYGNGHGALAELVYRPAERLRQLFLRRGVRFVNFVEVAEFQRIEEVGSDLAIDAVKRQVRDLQADGFETALHLHPQWCNARHEHGRWILDFSEYNLCALPRLRIAEIVDCSLGYLRHLLDDPSFTPFSFRAGNWLFQPTQPLARVLEEKGLRIDSSVFKGGLQRARGMDYRRSLKNGDYWTFGSDVNDPDPDGALIEIPIYVRMVPFWRALTAKRMKLGRSVAATGHGGSDRLSRLGDFIRFRYPLKFDFCRMTLSELTGMMDRVISEDRGDPNGLRPVVAIGHTKDLFDLGTVEEFLTYLDTHSIPVVTFADLYPRFSRDSGAFRASWGNESS